MKHRFGSVVAVMATASIVLAGGEGEDKKGEKSKKGTRRVEELANAPQGGPSVSAAAGKGFTISTGDDFKLNVGNRVQVLWRYANFEKANAIPASAPLNGSPFAVAGGAPARVGTDTNNFSLRRVRTKLKGHVWNEDIRYMVQLDWVSGRTVKDAYVHWGIFESDDEDNALSVRLGQFKPRHGKEFEGSSSALEHSQRSLASRNFSGLRVLGVRLEGDHMDNQLHWGFGIVNGEVGAAARGGGAGVGSTTRQIVEGTGDGAANADEELNFLIDVRFDPWGDMGAGVHQGDLDYTEEVRGSFGAGLFLGNSTPTAAHHVNALAGTTVGDIETTSININTVWKYQGFYALGEIFIRSDDPDSTGAVRAQESDHLGWNIAASYTMPEPDDGIQWGGGARISMIENDPGSAGGFTQGSQVLVMNRGNPVGNGLGVLAGEVLELGASINAYYHKHRLKTTLSYTFQAVDFDASTQQSLSLTAPVSDSDNHFLDLMFQWMF